MDSREKYCGDVSPNGKNSQRVIKSSGKTLTVEFVADTSKQERGFKARWWITKRSTVKPSGMSIIFDLKYQSLYKRLIERDFKLDDQLKKSFTAICLLMMELKSSLYVSFMIARLYCHHLSL